MQRVAIEPVPVSKQGLAAMSLILSCPQCARKLKVPDTSGGKKVKCVCEHIFVAAGEAAPAAGADRVIVSCSECATRLKAPIASLGKKMKCPSCCAVFVASVPQVTAVATPAATTAFAADEDEGRLARQPRPPLDEPVDFDDLEDEEMPRPRARKKRAAVDEEIAAPSDDKSATERHAPVLAEIDRLEKKQTSSLATALWLGVSIIAFMAAGAASWSLRVALLLIPILFFHELGHFVAMRLFRYRNLRMFFIPLFGAAVTGQHYNVPGWKKAIVSLLGPLPGIFVGAVLGGAGLWYQNKLLLEVAALTVFVNGFNLLPLLPLDGGWVVHAILFSRHYLLDAAVRLMTALFLIGAGRFAQDWILTAVGIGMLLSLPLAYRLGKIAALLRSRVAVTSPDSQNIPPETACAILDELRKALPLNTSIQMLAKHTLQVFESLNARAPGWLATIALAIVHAGSFIFAVALAAVFMVAQHSNLGDFVRQAAVMPPNPLACGSIRTWQSAARAADAPSLTLCANFKDAGAATKVFDEVCAKDPAHMSLVLLGQTVLMEVPAGDDAARRQWLEFLEARCQDVTVGDKEAGVPMVLVGMAPNAEAAARISTEAQAYFQMPPDCHLVAPWSSAPALTPEQLRARRTWIKVQEKNAQNFGDPEMAKIGREMATAQRRRDKQAIADAQQRQRARLAALRKAQLDAMRNDPDLDRRILDVAATRPGDVDLDFDDEGAVPPRGADFQQQYRDWHARLGEPMGQLPLKDGKVAPGADRLSARFGSAMQNGLMLRFDFLSFVRPAAGAPALVDWLCQHQFVDLKYQFITRPDRDD